MSFYISKILIQKEKTYALIKDEVRKASYVMAVNDAFMLIGFCLVLGGAIVWICKKTEAKIGAAD